MKIPDQFMVIDDDPINNLVCQYILSDTFPGSDVLVFEDAQNALDAIKDAHFTISAIRNTAILLDINMPGLSGWDFLNLFSHLPDNVRQQFTIYMLSSSVDHRDKEKAGANSLVSGFVSKPLVSEWLQSEFH